MLRRRKHLEEQLARLTEQLEQLEQQQRERELELEKRLVRLHLKKDARSVEGILYHADRLHFYLANARMLVSPGRDAAELDGSTWWPREDVFHVQELEPR